MNRDLNAYEYRKKENILFCPKIINKIADLNGYCVKRK